MMAIKGEGDDKDDEPYQGNKTLSENKKVVKQKLQVQFKTILTINVKSP
jgi:hypothetical protein